MTRILALDLGTKTGYALADAGKLIVSGTVEHKGGRYSGGGMRFLLFRNWLREMQALEAVDIVYFEEVRRHMSTDSAHVYGGLMAHLAAWCEEAGIPYEGIPVQTIKISATGKGNAKKGAVIAAMNKRWSMKMDEGEKSKFDNEADALAILHHVLLTQPAPARRKRKELKL